MANLSDSNTLYSSADPVSDTKLTNPLNFYSFRAVLDSIKMFYHFYSVHLESENTDLVLLKNSPVRSSKSLASEPDYLEKDHVNFISRNAINIPLKGRLIPM